MARRVVGLKDPRDDDIAMLLQLGTFEGCEGYAITDADQVEGNVPPWAEIAFTITRDGKKLVHYLTRHDGEVVVMTLLRTLHPTAGRPVIGFLWDRLDAAYVRIVQGDPGEDRTKAQGEALGLAFAIATVRAPHAPDVDAVRKEARERYEAR